MEMKRSEIEDVFGARYGIRQERLVAFRGRLQHLQRLGFPRGINTGRGRQAVYGWGQIILLSLALDLIDIGLPPEVAVNLLADNEHSILSLVAGSVAKEERPWIEKSIREAGCPFHKRIFVALHSHALHKLARPDRATPPSLGLYEAPEFLQSIQDANPYESGGTWVDASSRLFLSIHDVSNLCRTPVDALTDDFENWASSYGQHS